MKIITIIYTSHITVIVNGMYSLDFKNIIDKYKIQPIPILHVIIAPPSIKPSPIFFFLRPIIYIGFLYSFDIHTRRCLRPTNPYTPTALLPLTIAAFYCLFTCTFQHTLHPFSISNFYLRCLYL